MVRLVLDQLFNNAAWAQESGSFLPPSGSAIASQVDSLYSFLLWASLISCIILIGGMIYFALKYKRRTANDKTPYISHNIQLEFLWSFIPLVIFLIVFAWGWYIYRGMKDFPKDALEVNIMGRQWAWDFYYKSGKVTTNDFYVPVHTPVKLILGSKDVIHSFFIPSLRLKQDAVPGRYTALWFNAEKTGDYQVFCSQYCGMAHSGMLAKMHVVPMAEYEKFLQESDEGLSLADKGKKLYNDKGCVACHSIDGTKKVGPSWKGLYGRKDEPMMGGFKVDADENYIRESILQPSAKVVEGYGTMVDGKPVSPMPSFQGQVTDVEITALIEYIKSLK